jgi:hypothetical protein
MIPGLLRFTRLPEPRSAAHAAFLATVLAAAGCSATLPRALLVPGETEGVTAYFNRGAPFAVMRDERRTTVAALEPAVLAREGYLRLWLYVANETDVAQQIDPRHDLSMKLRIDSRNEDREIVPASPDRILDQMAFVGERYPSRRFEKRVDPTEDEAGVWMEAYRRDTHHHGSERTMLKRETLLPGENVHGFIYFPVPMRFSVAAGESLSGGQVFLGPRDGPRSLDDFHVKVRMRTSKGEEEIAFEPTGAE